MRACFDLISPLISQTTKHIQSIVSSTIETTGDTIVDTCKNSFARVPDTGAVNTHTECRK